MKKPAILILLLLSVVNAQDAAAPLSAGNSEIYEGLVFGIGPGTLAVIIAALIGMVMCLFKDSIEAPNTCVAGAILLPLIVFGIVRALPVKSLNTDAEQTDALPTDAYLVRTAIICSVIYASALAMCFLLFCSSFTHQIMGTRIDS
jgi:hypothetical protein